MITSQLCLMVFYANVWCLMDLLLKLDTVLYPATLYYFLFECLVTQSKVYHSL